MKGWFSDFLSRMVTGGSMTTERVQRMILANLDIRGTASIAELAAVLPHPTLYEMRIYKVQEAAQILLNSRRVTVLRNGRQVDSVYLPGPEKLMLKYPGTDHEPSNAG